MMRRLNVMNSIRITRPCTSLRRPPLVILEENRRVETRWSAYWTASDRRLTALVITLTNTSATDDFMYFLRQEACETTWRILKTHLTKTPVFMIGTSRLEGSACSRKPLQNEISLNKEFNSRLVKISTAAGRLQRALSAGARRLRKTGAARKLALLLNDGLCG
ncbi:hypothetical protein EVAR_26079_1 [Eumeta japonica]|uniref:Uncharacterized protein n=1 Tax=Eumeta variegata TaxID=151549 RepID=A0A4C1WXC0_EUMVA|nr:hypothetical protein EVAR_26079_1 [Eumeta japonica]